MIEFVVRFYVRSRLSGDRVIISIVVAADGRFFFYFAHFSPKWSIPNHNELFVDGHKMTERQQRAAASPFSMNDNANNVQFHW